jgi:hypothetical protein
MIYLYAIADRPELALPPISGLEGAPLVTLPCRDIVAVVSDLDAGSVQPTEAHLWQHEAVVEALMANRAVLPVRFGAQLADEATLQAALESHYAGLVADLARVRGRVELGLRVLWQNEVSSPAEKNEGKPARGDGWAYMLARLAEDRQRQAQRSRAEALAADLHAPLAYCAADSTRQVLLTPRLLLTAAYLVDRDRQSAFRREVEALRQAHPDLDFLCTGPWPAYSFVTASNRAISG